MTNRTFDAVIFDMDGVLCDSEPFIAAAAAEALRRRYGIAVAREDFLPFVGRRRRPVHRGAAAAPRRDGRSRDRQGADLRDLPRADRGARCSRSRGCTRSSQRRARPGFASRSPRAPTGPSSTATLPRSGRRVGVRRRDLGRARDAQEAGPGDVPAWRSSGWGCRPRAASWWRMRLNGVRAGRAAGAPCSGSPPPSRPRYCWTRGLRRRARLHGAAGGRPGGPGTAPGLTLGIRWTRPRRPPRPRPPAAPGGGARARHPPARSRARS